VQVLDTVEGRQIRTDRRDGGALTFKAVRRLDDAFVLSRDQQIEPIAREESTLREANLVHASPCGSVRDLWSSLLHGFAEIAKSPVVALGGQEMADSDDGGDRPLDDPHHRQRGQSSEIDQQVTRGKINGSQDRKLQPAAIAEGRRRTVVIRPSR
jgi:hypothetical protein